MTGVAAPRRPAIERAQVAPGAAARLLGLGSVFGKAFRDSRRTGLVLGVLYAVVVGLTASQIITEFDTAAKRAAMAAQLTALPEIFQGMLGKPIEITHLGGFISWRLLNFLPLFYGIWSVIALSGTLAGELSRGSMELVAASPVRRRLIATEKLAGYLGALALTSAIIGIGAWLSITALAVLPGDTVGADAIAAHALWLFVMMLAPGAVSFALAPIVGRGAALGLGAIALFGSFVVNAYADTVSAFDAVRGLSYFELTEGHRPIAGAWDWGSMAVLSGVVLVLLVIGIEAFARRDLLAPGSGRLRLPKIRLWIQGPFSRGFGERLPAALAWGAGLAAYAVLVASSSGQFVATIKNIPEITKMVEQLFPDADILSTAGFLQLAFYQEAIIILGLATAAFVAGWASDEGDRRLEVVLGAPMTRGGWAIRSALSVMAAIALATLILDVAVAIGVQIQGDDPVPIAKGTTVLGLYAMALAGIGLAVGGLVRPSLAAPVTLGLAVGFYLWDVIGTILRFPDALLDLALSRHLGQPIVGDFDVPGLATCAALAVGGVMLCAMGMQRRDIGR